MICLQARITIRVFHLSCTGGVWLPELYQVNHAQVNSGQKIIAWNVHYNHLIPEAVAAWPQSYSR